MRVRVTGLEVMLLVSTACSSGGGGGGFVTSVGSNKTLMTLSSADTMQLCTDFQAYLSRNISTSEGCKLAGLPAAQSAFYANPSASDSSLQSACASAAMACASSTADGGSAATCPIGDPTTCSATATVSEYSDCANDAVPMEKATLAAIPDCSSITAATFTADGGWLGTVTVPASCVKLMTDCPDLLLPGG